MSGKLYIVGTPIGNLGDFSPRAVETLCSVDFIAAEDTRVTVKLLNHFDIKKPLISYFEHNKYQRGDVIVGRISAGESCALVTDAGMPAVSDPGEMLIFQCREQNITVECVPGPTALITALASSGLPSGRFCFEGFLSMNKKDRKSHLESLKDEKRTMVFYEAPHKLKNTLDDLLEAFGNRRISISRELTKIHEETVVTTLENAASMYDDAPPRGEFVLVIEGSAENANENEAFTLEQAVALAHEYVKEGIGTSAAAKKAAVLTGIKKGDIYSQLI